MLTTGSWAFAFPEVGHPISNSLHAVFLLGPYLFDQSSQKENISTEILSFISQTSKSLESLHNFVFILGAVLIRN